MIEINLDTAKKLMAEVVEEYGSDHKYFNPDIKGWEVGGGCQYTHFKNQDGTEADGLVPGCLVGTILIKAGVDPDEIHPDVGRWIADLPLYSARIDPGARKFMGVAQDSQDRGRSWGTAQADALEYVRVNTYADESFLA